MSVKYTRGPWLISTIPFEINNTDLIAAIYGPFNHGGSPRIADVSRSTGDYSAYANAKLIAAAPELLDAANEALRLLRALEAGDGSLYPDTRDMLSKAINKATL